jgi:arsenate reductase
MMRTLSNYTPGTRFARPHAPRSSAKLRGGRGYDRGMEIWFNPRCSKCRLAKDFLDEAGAEYTIRRYLEEPPTAAEIREVLGRLELEPWEIVRTGEAVAKELGVSRWGKTPADREQWIAAMAGHPALIQRPIITADDGRAVVGRDERSLKGIVG